MLKPHPSAMLISPMQTYLKSFCSRANLYFSSSEHGHATLPQACGRTLFYSILSSHLSFSCVLPLTALTPCRDGWNQLRRAMLGDV